MNSPRARAPWYQKSKSKIDASELNYKNQAFYNFVVVMKSPMTIGHIHGRFQPFHSGHARYAQWAAEECDELIIGITNADPSHIKEEETDQKRHQKKHNPFLYYERYRMIENFVNSASISTPISIMPFPINFPDLWGYYAPPGATHFIFVLEEWHEVKADRIRSHDRNVVTKQAQRDVSGSSIRGKMASGRAWESEVPDAVAATIGRFRGVERVRNLYS